MRTRRIWVLVRSGGVGHGSLAGDDNEIVQQLPRITATATGATDPLVFTLTVEPGGK